MILVDKPEGMTSHDVVAVARRSMGIRRIGHTGTLDPFASGLLVLLLGRSTRLLPYVDAEPKIYEAVIAFGEERSTDDLTGDVVRRAEPPSAERIRREIPSLTGWIKQIPPAYSAKQKEGVRAYAAARRGAPLDLPSETVFVGSWKTLHYQSGLLDVRVECGTGTYIRGLARDLGRLCASAAHLVQLRRLAAGVFSVDDAVRIAERSPGTGDLLPSLAAVRHLDRRRLSDPELDHVVHGRSIPAGPGDTSFVAAVDGNGVLAAILRRDEGVLRPKLVLRDA